MPFIAKHSQEQYIIDLMREGFSRFIDIHVACFDSAKDFEVGFVGSIAFIFKDLLEDELNKRGFTAGKIIKSPINELVNYHRNYLSIGSSKSEKENSQKERVY